MEVTNISDVKVLPDLTHYVGKTVDLELVASLEMILAMPAK